MSTHLAMDLGTCNTCLAQQTHGGEDSLVQPQGCCTIAVGGTVPTLVLYAAGEPIAIGAQAEAEYGEANPHKRNTWRLAALFKPDLAVREEARQEMTDFLRLLGQAVVLPDSVLVGIPSETSNLYREQLRSCLQNAGWGQARFLSEPLGAVIHYLTRGILPPSQAARGVLTVDFGGGTCDFALLRRASVTARSGDMLYGGRLFDDLFWQMLLQKYPELEQELTREGNSYYVHWLACRQAKEEFSRAMYRDREQKVTLRIRWSVWDGHTVTERSVYLENLTWRNFLLQAGNYTASSSMLDFLREHGGKAGLSPQAEALLAGRQVDLVQWFEDVLRAALPNDGFVPTVLLTGGSSAWPFVEDVVRQYLGLDATILIGDEPYADIGRGLARYYDFSQRLRHGRAALDADLPYFTERRLPRVLHRVMESAVEEMVSVCVDFLRDTVIIPCCARYRQEGGSLRDLRESMECDLEEKKGSMVTLLKGMAANLAEDLAEACREELRQWFQEKGIPVLPERLRRISLGGVEEVLIRMRQGLHTAVMAPLRDRLALAVAATLGLAGMTGAGAVGLLASGFAALPVLAAAGLGGAAVKYSDAGKRLLDRMQDWPLPALVRKMLTDVRMAELAEEICKEFRKALGQFLYEAWRYGEERMTRETGELAREEIAALDILHVTPS